MKVKRKIVKIDEELCDGCGQCVPSCAEGAIELVDGRARIVAEKYCDGLGACLGECPKGALTIVERDADDFDEAAVEKHLASIKMEEPVQGGTMACGCPSTLIQSFGPMASCEGANRATIQDGPGSALSHWPIQIRLVPPTAPFLKGAHLLVAADCTAVACPHFHEDFLKGKAVMMGCPKFDDAQAYIDKFSEIFKAADIKSVTVLDMEVPCCSALPMIVRRGMEAAGKKIPTEEIVITPKGAILKRQRLAA